ncbi:uncharacterized protein LOC119496788 [Sebastes umbrosus]|uniref:uncharacterized protein LOC119496788 n=1 Tax=Sebastes umbrosus TaxID=72105 RepID=UPI00189E3A77|nr:uncharacterized protein LOC119496788 [Sebastes umbrosus]
MTVITVPVDSKGIFPSLWQILKALLCPGGRPCRPCCCCSSEYQYQRLTQSSVTTTALGTLQIMVGLFNIGLGPGRTSTSPGDLTSLGAAYWLGAVFIVTGIMSILAGQFPSSCLVGFTVFMNIAGAIFAITGIVLYVVDLRNVSLLWMCERSGNNTDLYGDKCRNVALSAQNLLTHMDTTLIAMAVLQLFVNVGLAVLCIKALVNRKKKEGGDDVEDQQPQLKEEVLLTSPGDEKQFN